MIFGMALLPLMDLTGAVVDESRASQLRSKIAAASDAAVLADVKTQGSLGDIQKAANAAFAANLGTDPSLVGALTALPGNSYRCEVSADYSYPFLGIMLGMPGSTKLSVYSEANAGVVSVAVALVLDNTGLMKSDMGALHTAGESFTNILFDRAANGADLKMSVVPYVAAVNPRWFNLGMSSVDTRFNSEWQARNLRWLWIGFLPDCTDDPFWKPGPGGDGGGGGGGPGVGWRRSLAPGCNTQAWRNWPRVFRHQEHVGKVRYLRHASPKGSVCRQGNHRQQALYQDRLRQGIRSDRLRL